MKHFYVLLIVALGFAGCKKEKLQAPPAGFLVMDDVSLNLTSSQGTTNHKITDGWVYVNEQFKGAYPIGNIIPIASTGNTALLIYPGIKNNGISKTRVPYPLMQPIQLDTFVTAGQTIHYHPKFKYYSGVLFHWVEGFEGLGVTLVKSNNSDTAYQMLDKTVDPTADVFEGNRAVYITMDAARSVAAFESATMYSLPNAGVPVYLEINYKCNQPFDIGIKNATESRFCLTVNTSEQWNKIYVSLAEQVSTSPIYPQWSIYLMATKSVSNPQIYIDNIKLVSF